MAYSPPPVTNAATPEAVVRVPGPTSAASDASVTAARTRFMVADSTAAEGEASCPDRHLLERKRSEGGAEEREGGWRSSPPTNPFSSLVVSRLWLKRPSSR